MENIDFMDFKSLYPSEMMNIDNIIECLKWYVPSKNISYQGLVNKIKKMQNQRKNELYGKVGVDKNGK